VAKKYHKNNLIFNGQNLLSKLGSRLQPAENIRSIMSTRLPRSLSPPFFLSTLSQARVIWVAPYSEGTSDGTRIGSEGTSDGTRIGSEGTSDFEVT
jgi:hypothetical protein